MSYEIQQTIEQAWAAGKAKGCVCVEPASDQLFLDLDSESAIVNFKRLWSSFLAEEPGSYTITPSPSGHPGRVHVVVTLDRTVKSPLERIALQAVLGSDPMRELLNWRRLVSGVPHEANNILFELAKPRTPLLVRLGLWLVRIGSCPRR